MNIYIYTYIYIYVDTYIGACVCTCIDLKADVYAGTIFPSAHVCPAHSTWIPPVGSLLKL